MTVTVTSFVKQILLLVTRYFVHSYSIRTVLLDIGNDFLVDIDIGSPEVV